MREEEINQAAKEHAKSSLVGSLYYKESSFKQGAEWADKTMINKACEWLLEHTSCCSLELERFRKTMES